MPRQMQLVIDAADPNRVAEFWAEALGYHLDPPPAGFDSWEAFLDAQGVPPERRNDASAVSDPSGQGPRVFIQKVPEPKQAKNRLHIDINVSGGRSVELSERQQRVHAEADRLAGVGATQLRVGQGQFGEYFIVMQDPEGNEFCVQ